MQMSIFPNTAVAQIRNISQCYEAVKRTMDRNPLLPGISAFMVQVDLESLPQPTMWRPKPMHFMFK
jgi:hypothetical protein